ncbi:hypothetical protein M8494_29125 [Serratia ureilytica]
MQRRPMGLSPRWCRPAWASPCCRSRRLPLAGQGKPVWLPLEPRMVENRPDLAPGSYPSHSAQAWIACRRDYWPPLK